MTNEENIYPLIEQKPDAIRTSSGRHLAEISMENVESGELSTEEMRIDAQTLMDQAKIASGAGLVQLAANLTRAAELTAVPNAKLLEMYEMLRPGRSTYEELTTLASTLEEQFNAPENARLVREAARVYKERGLLRREAATGNTGSATM